MILCVKVLVCEFIVNKCVIYGIWFILVDVGIVVYFIFRVFCWNGNVMNK